MELQEYIFRRIGIIRYLISLKSGITYIFSHYHAKIKVDSYDSLPTVKRLTLHNVKNHYYYKIFLQKCSYQLAKKKFFIV